MDTIETECDNLQITKAPYLIENSRETSNVKTEMLLCFK